MNVPAQHLNDCGLAVIINAERLSRKSNFIYHLHPEISEFIRLQIAICILRFKPLNIEIIIPEEKRIDPLDNQIMDAVEDIIASQIPLINIYVNCPSLPQGSTGESQADRTSTGKHICG